MLTFSLRAAFVALLLTAPAYAQSGVGFDPSEETAIDAERVERFEGGNRMVGSGGITITQPGVILKAERMEITFIPGTSEIDNLIAIGKVRYANVDGDAIAGARAVYRANDDQLTVTGDVVVLQGGQIATGNELVYNTDTGAMTMTSGPGGRVRSLIPKKADS
ncbi:MAG: LptA/OstA family protein [Pseudomonadota bacterium]